MFENGLIISRRKLTPREVKKKFRDFVDGIAEECGPEIEELAEDLKTHGDEFIDALSGSGKSGGSYRGHGYRGAMGGGSYRGSAVNMGNGSAGAYRKDGDWQNSDQLPMRRGGGFRDSELESAYREGYEKAKMERELIDDEAMRRNSRFGR